MIRSMLDVQDLAEVLNMSARTVWRWVRADRIQAVRLGPQVVRFTYEEAERVVYGRARAIIGRVAVSRLDKGHDH